MFSKVTKSTVDEKEIRRFAGLSEVWWNENGAAKPLHTMNEMRLPMMKGALQKGGLLKEEYAHTGWYLTGLKILDVGCGGGLFAEPLATLGAEVTGIDPTEEMIKVAKHHATLSEPPLNINYLPGTVGDYVEEFEGKFDCVVISEVVQHVVDQEVFLEGCCKCLRPGGYMYITTFNKTWIARAMAIWLAEYVVNAIPKGAHDFAKFIAPEDVTNILEKSMKRSPVEGWTVQWLLNPLSYDLISNRTCHEKQQGHGLAERSKLCNSLQDLRKFILSK